MMHNCATPPQLDVGTGNFSLSAAGVSLSVNLDTLVEERGKAAAGELSEDGHYSVRREWMRGGVVLNPHEASRAPSSRSRTWLPFD